MASKKQMIGAECRNCNDDWRWKFFFTLVKGNAVCLICNTSVAVFKEYNLIRHFENRFECFNRINKILSIVRNPFTANIEEASSNIQLELIELQCDQLLHDKYREEEDNLCNFYKQLDSKKYVNLKNLGKKNLVVFSSNRISLRYRKGWRPLRVRIALRERPSGVLLVRT